MLENFNTQIPFLYMKNGSLEKIFCNGTKNIILSSTLAADDKDSSEITLNMSYNFNVFPALF
jgi:hypothetical protein